MDGATTNLQDDMLEGTSSRKLTTVAAEAGIDGHGMAEAQPWDERRHRRHRRRRGSSFSRSGGEPKA
jgi:hypothetical protein